jgi:hypothetical protein
MLLDCQFFELLVIYSDELPMTILTLDGSDDSVLIIL